ncbi:Centrosomal protein [Halotydeus destructor]|nr:Centrosomal protein [Halotydeus destructor]
MAPINEKNSLKIAVSDEKVLATYFALNPTLEIQFCENSGKAHGTVTVSLNSFAVTDQQPKSVSGEFKFLPTDDTIVINEPVTVIDMSVKVQRLLSEELPQTPRISANNRKGISVGQQEIHHICLSLDIRKLNVSLTSCLPLRDVFVQYSYANLGYTKKIKTEAIEIIRDVSEFKVFKDGYFAFNFASTLDRLSNTMSEPLIFELVQKTKDKNMLIAIGHLKLDEVLQASKPDQNENVKCVKVQLLDTSDSELGQLDVIACLNDVGPANGDMHFSSLSQPTFLNSTDQSTSDPAMKELENLLIEAAVEVEIWKQKKMNNFLDDLRRKEEHYLKSLAEDNDKVLENRKKVLDEREANLSNMLKKLEVKEDVLAHKEKVLDEKEKILMLRLETLDREITIAIEDVKKSMDAKLKVEQEKNVALEDNLKKISDRNPLSTVRETSRSMRSPSNSESANIRARSCLGRANSVPNSVRSASKQRNGTLPASETPPPRRSESIARTQNNSVPAARLRTQPSKPAVITKVINTNGTSNGIWSTARSTVTRNTLMDRKNILLTKLQQEKSELLATKVVPPDDIMIKTIDAELRKHGVYKRK